MTSVNIKIKQLASFDKGCLVFTRDVQFYVERVHAFGAYMVHWTLKTPPM